MQQRMSRKDIERIRREFDLLLKDPDKYEKKHGWASYDWESEVLRLARLLKGSGLSNRRRQTTQGAGLLRGRTGRIPIVTAKEKIEALNK